MLPGGGVLLDTPGLRELQLWDAGTGLDAAFSDIAALASRIFLSIVGNPQSFAPDAIRQAMG